MKKQLSALTAGLLMVWVVSGCATQTPPAQTSKTTEKAVEKVVVKPKSGVRSPSMLANTCAGCHGTDGASAGDIMPVIGGMENVDKIKKGDSANNGSVKDPDKIIKMKMATDQ